MTNQKNAPTPIRGNRRRSKLGRFAIREFARARRESEAITDYETHGPRRRRAKTTRRETTDA